MEKENNLKSLIRGLIFGLILFLFFFYFYYTGTPYPFNLGDSEHANPAYGRVSLLTVIFFTLIGFLVGFLWSQDS